MKLAVIIFHQNVNRYPQSWIDDCIKSIQNQTFKNFQVFEIDYGGNNIQIYPGGNFESIILNNHAEAHNYLLDKVFLLDFDYAFNVNIDDLYSVNRIEKQLEFAKKGFDVISSNFYTIDEYGKVQNEFIMNDKNFEYEAAKGHNIISHPVVCYSKHFWTTCSKLHPNEIPLDDFSLWKRSYSHYKFVIVPDFLLYYRVHSKKISAPITDLSKNESFIPGTSKIEQNRINDQKREEWLKHN